MSDFDGAVINPPVEAPAAVPISRAPLAPAPSPSRTTALVATVRSANVGMWPRVVAVVVLSVLAYGASYESVIVDAVNGSRTAYLVVVPVLAALIATGYRSAPRGVGDSESDWIIATLFGVIGISGNYLLNQRIPTLAGFWRLDLLSVVIWLGCAVAVMFGVRHVVRMWALWLFALCCATPVPFLLATARLGGSNLAATLVAAAVGALAVLLAGRYASIGRRLASSVGCFAVAAAFVVVASDRIDTLWTVVVAGGLVPVLATVAASRAFMAGHEGADPTIRRSYPHLSTISLVVLTATAAAIHVAVPEAASAPAPTTASADWVTRAGLGAPTNFPFITRFLGSGSTLNRYDIPGPAGVPVAAVDIMTTTNRAALDDFADAVWYPTSRPLNYASAGHADAMPSGARVIHTDADTATNGAQGDWYAVTWVWRTGEVSQRVTVIVSQTIRGDQAPPPPAPLTLVDTAVRPVMWVARQQPDAISRVDPLVSQRADALVRLLVDGGVRPDEMPTGD